MTIYFILLCKGCLLFAKQTAIIIGLFMFLFVLICPIAVINCLLFTCFLHHLLKAQWLKLPQSTRDNIVFLFLWHLLPNMSCAWPKVKIVVATADTGQQDFLGFVLPLNTHLYSLIVGKHCGFQLCSCPTPFSIVVMEWTFVLL